MCVKNIQTQKLETIQKGTLVWMFDETTEFEHFFKFVYSNKIYQAIQDEFEDGVLNQRLQTKETKINTRHNETINIYETQNK